MSLNQYISKQFSSPVGIGGKVISFVMNRQNRPLYDESIRLLASTDDDSILDIGCGNGFVMSLLTKESRCTLTGIDPSESIIKDAHRRYGRHIKEGRMCFQCKGTDTMSFADNSFSKAYTINTVYFWDNLNNTLSSIRKVLKPNGIFINTLYSNKTLDGFSHTDFGYKRFTIEQLTSAGHALGFFVKVIPILNGRAYCVIYQRQD